MEINLHKYFNWAFIFELKKKKIQYTQTELDEFLEDGFNILYEFVQIENLLKYFPPNKYELLDIEHEINATVQYDLNMVGHLDLVLKDKQTGRIKIVDIKTSTRGWNSYQREDFTKLSQLILYKLLYSNKHNIPLSKIDIEFFIVKRKLYENVAYKQSYIQTLVPKSNKDEVNEVMGEIGKFIKECFLPTGEYNTSIEYKKIPGKNKKNCTYCSHKNKNCDAIPN